MTACASSSRFTQAGWVRLAMVALLAGPAAWAGGPKYVAGVSFFNPAAAGQPLHWAGGQVNYYVDPGPLNDSVSHGQAQAMVDAAASLWSAVPTAGVTLVDQGALNEDVSGANILVNQSGQIAAPSDVTPSATHYPVGVIFDADGAVIDAIYGPTASAPGACQENSVFVWLDNFNPDATFAHGIILLNGRCASSADLLAMMSFELERAFGRILGLGFSQVNPGAFESGLPEAEQGLPVMEPLTGACGASGGNCIPAPMGLRYDDIAALNRLYPITAGNLGNFPGKQVTAANTVSIRGSIFFGSGYGMQGVNVVARPLDANGNPLYQYTVSAVSGALFSGEHGNPVTGWTDANGEPFAMWGSVDPGEQGAFDLSGIPLPPGMSAADYQITFESIDPLYILENGVGPYVDGQVAPSGLLGPVTLPGLAAGSAQTLTFTGAGSAAVDDNDAIGSEAQPRQLPASGFWAGRLSQVGQTDWFAFPVRGNRIFTIVTEALDENGAPTNAKAMPSIGVWDGFDAVEAAPVGATPGPNGMAAGETFLRVTASGDDIVRAGIADQRGDGRPDYGYEGWVLYADTVAPARLPASGGPIVIRGMGFRLADTVMVNGQPALVTSISPNEISAIAPPAAKGVTGSVDVEVDDAPILYAAAVVQGGLSYDAGAGDGLTLVTAPMNTVPIGVPLPFTVKALGATMAPAGGVTVVYTVSSGTALLACGRPVCSVVASGDGLATMNVSAPDGTWSIVTASLTNGASLQAQFAGGTPPVLTALTPRLSLAAGATLAWTVQALALQNGVPAVGQAVVFGTGSGFAVQGPATATTDAHGIATQILTVGPLAEGQQASIQACVNGTAQCAQFTAFGARPEYAALQAVSGTAQSLPLSGTPSQIVLRVLDMDGNPMAGAAVMLYQALYAWTPPCAAHTACAPGTLLGTQSGVSASAVDGTVSFAPAAMPGVATNLFGLAASGTSATVSITVEQHP
ncbi:MAG: IPT/TIG domain-containing protein [Acidobacteriota bacterium]